MQTQMQMIIIHLKVHHQCKDLNRTCLLLYRDHLSLQSLVKENLNKRYTR